MALDGTVNFYSSKKGFGMILSGDGTSIFFHRSGLDTEGLEEGDKVSFLVKEGLVTGTLTAYNVKKNN